MPTYEYACDACDHQFEEFQSITAEPLKKCPECGKTRLRRLFGTGAAIIFKGSGFYQTDYRSDSYKSAAKAEQDKSKGTENKTDKSDNSAKSDASSKGTKKETSTKAKT